MSIHTSGEYQDRGRSLLMSDRAHEALAVFEEGARRYPGDHDLQLGAALALARTGQSVRAERLLAELLARRPLDPETLEALAEARLSRGLVQEAFDAAADILRRPDADARTARRLGRLFYDAKQRRAALPLYETAVALDDKDAEAWFGLGACRWALRQNPTAVVALRRAAALAPEDWSVRQFLGCALYDMGLREEALKTLEAVPLDAAWQKPALERLVALSWWPSDPARRAALEALWREATASPKP